MQQRAAAAAARCAVYYGVLRLSGVKPQVIVASWVSVGISDADRSAQSKVFRQLNTSDAALKGVHVTVVDLDNILLGV